MKKLAYLCLAASTAMIPAAALAQDRTVDPPAKWEDVPDARLKAPPGTSWQAPPPAAPRAATPPAAPRAAPPPMRQAAPAPIRTVPPAPVVRRAETAPVPPPPAHHAAPPSHPPRHHAPAHAGTHHGRQGDKMQREKVVIHHGDGDHRETRVHVRKMQPGYSRVERGHRVDGYWMGPGHHVHDWRRYGFSQPYEDRRWIRYHDDALLIDRYGTVHDGRYGMDWDEYGDDWGYDERGIPVYVGDGDYHPDDEDYAYVEEHGDYGYGQGQGYGHAYPGHYGYGHYGWGTVTITETTVTHASTVCCEEPAPRHKVKKRHYKSRPRAKPGERG